MEEELYYILEASGGMVVDGCESMTIQQAEEWLNIYQEKDIETPCGDLVKYIRIPVNHIHN